MGPQLASRRRRVRLLGPPSQFDLEILAGVETQREHSCLVSAILQRSTLAPTKTTVLFWDKYLGRMSSARVPARRKFEYCHRSLPSVEGREGHASIDSVHLKGTERSGVHSQKRKGREEKWRDAAVGILRRDEKVAVGEREGRKSDASSFNDGPQRSATAIESHRLCDMMFDDGGMNVRWGGHSADRPKRGGQSAAKVGFAMKEEKGTAASRR